MPLPPIRIHESSPQNNTWIFLYIYLLTISQISVKSRKWSFPFRFTEQDFYMFLVSLIHATFPTRLVLLDLDTVIFWGNIQARDVSHCTVSPAPCDSLCYVVILAGRCRSQATASRGRTGRPTVCTWMHMEHRWNNNGRLACLLTYLLT